MSVIKKEEIDHLKKICKNCVFFCENSLSCIEDFDFQIKAKAKDTCKNFKPIKLNELEN